MRRARAFFGAEESKHLPVVIAEDIQELRRYDIHAMDRVMAILMWGRSGSHLLASYLDGHDDVLMLPESCGQRLYEFFERYPSLSWREKLVAYTGFEPGYPNFFEGDFAISPARYHAAVQAILAFYDHWPTNFLDSRRAFFLFVHIAYSLALGRRPASSHPLIVYAQHTWDNVVAANLVEDFPGTKFVHTIRDPISSCNGLFNYHITFVEQHVPAQNFLPTIPYMALCCLTNKDRPQFGMESRTRTIRFEDLHAETANTMRELADWLGLPYQATLLHSTFNGLPYVVSRQGKTWSGRSLEQVRRHSINLSGKDRALLFVCFYENFAGWDYPCPKIFGNPIVRPVVFVALFLLPTKMEILAVRAAFKCRILPSLRNGKIAPAIQSLLAIVLCRLKIIWRLTSVFFGRCISRTRLLEVDPKGPPLEWRGDAAQAPAAETTVE